VHCQRLRLALAVISSTRADSALLTGITKGRSGSMDTHLPFRMSQNIRGWNGYGLEYQKTREPSSTREGADTEPSQLEGTSQVPTTPKEATSKVVFALQSSSSNPQWWFARCEARSWYIVSIRLQIESGSYIQPRQCEIEAQQRTHLCTAVNSDARNVRGVRRRPRVPLLAHTPPLRIRRRSAAGSLSPCLPAPRLA
jgi:hypothetical protein